MNRDILEQDPCNTCGYEEGSIYCKEHCPHEAKMDDLVKLCIEQERDCKTCIHSDKGKCAGTERCHECMWESKYEQEPCGDAISRKIISAFLSGLISDETERKKALQYVNELPSVNLQPCEDAISRQAVIDSLHSKFADGFDSDRWWNSMSVLYAINKVPPVNPTKTGQKTGHWIKMLLTDMSDIAGQCSECGFIHKFIGGHTAQYNYCPNCGARMESEE